MFAGETDETERWCWFRLQYRMLFTKLIVELRFYHAIIYFANCYGILQITEIKIVPFQAGEKGIDRNS